MGPCQHVVGNPGGSDELRCRHAYAGCRHVNPTLLQRDKLEELRAQANGRELARPAQP